MRHWPQAWRHDSPAGPVLMAKAGLAGPWQNLDATSLASNHGPPSPGGGCWRAILPGYNALFRLRLTYILGITNALFAAAALAGYIQTFFSLAVQYSPSDDSVHTTRTALVTFFVFMSVPLLFWLSCVVVDQMTQLLLDAMHGPPGTQFRGLMIEAGLAHVWADTLLIFALEVVPFVGIIVTLMFSWVAPLNGGGHVTFWGFIFDRAAGIGNGSLVVSGVLGILYTIMRALNYCGSPDPNDLRRTTLRLSNFELGEVYLLPPAEHVAASRHTPASYDPVDDATTHLLSRRGYREQNATTMHPRYLMAVACFLGALVILAITAMIVQSHVLSFFLIDDPFHIYGVAFVMVCISLAVMTRGSHVLVPGILGTVFHLMMLAFVVLVIFLALAARSFMYNDAESFGSDMLRDGPERPFTDIVFGAGLPVCGMRWGSWTAEPLNRLAALDMAIFSQAIYFPGDGADKAIREAFANTSIGEPKLETIQGNDVVGRLGSWSFPRSKTRVIAVRGTNTPSDVAIDVEVYAVIAVCQLFSFFVPLLHFTPKETVRALVKALTWVGDYDGAPWTRVSEEALRWKQQSDEEGYKLVITGHSLGGVLAGVAGARAGVPSVTFSPPGSYYNLYRFGATTGSFEGTETMIQPMRDMVPSVDAQQGFVQQVGCRASPVDCHSIERTRCALYDECGDPRGRPMAQTCQKYS